MSHNIDNGLRFMFNNYKTCRMIPSSAQCHWLLRGIANKMELKMDETQKERYLFYAQKLFDFAFNKNKGVSPGVYVYNPYIHIFAKMGDYATCLELLRCMREKEEYPQPDVFSCCYTLMAIVYLNEWNPDKIEIEAQNKCIQEVVEMMDQLGIKGNVRYYGVLFEICAQHKDIDRLLAYYEGIENKTDKYVERMATFAIECLNQMRKTQNMEKK
eukprot:233720_1